MDWPFDQPPNCATIFSRRVLDGSRPILRVSHDADDHGWQFLDGIGDALDDAALAALGRVLEIDPSIAELAGMPPGSRARRARPGDEWTIEPVPARG